MGSEESGKPPRTLRVDQEPDSRYGYIEKSNFGAGDKWATESRSATYVTPSDSEPSGTKIVEYREIIDYDRETGSYTRYRITRQHADRPETKVTFKIEKGNITEEYKI